MQVRTCLLLIVCIGLASTPALADPGRRPDRPDRPGWSSGRNDRWPGVWVEPNITIERNRAHDVDNPQFIMAELSRCAAAGVRLFVDCLRHNHGSIMIRRLEACVGSEIIPDDPRPVEPCLPLPAVVAPRQD